MSVSVEGRELPVGYGAAVGAGVWVLGYLFTYVLTVDEVRNSPARRVIQALGGELPTWKVVGWVFYNAHFASTKFQGVLGSSSGNFVGGEDGFTPLLFVVPPLLLVAGGLAVGRMAGVGNRETGDAVAAGLTVLVGYAVLSVVGVFLFAVEGTGPEPVASVFLAGVVYPALFGAVGAVIAGATG